MAKFLPSSAKPQLPTAAQAGLAFLFSLTKFDIVHHNDKNNIKAESPGSKSRFNDQA